MLELERKEPIVGWCYNPELGINTDHELLEAVNKK
jgi:hypothetical protein